MNLILHTDSYKASHARQYPDGTDCIYSYFESRGGEFSETVFFGLQYYLRKYLSGVAVSREDVEEADKLFSAHIGGGLFNKAGWMHIVDTHGGRLPVQIKAVPEGTVLPTRNVLMTIENTDPACWWLTNYLETLLVQCWYPSTVATISREMKKSILQSLKESGTDSPDNLAFKLHDFGCRGSTSMESAAIGGAAHLVNFSGTDTVPALRLLQEHYGATMPGFSIPAAEHSTITSWGESGEVDAYSNMLKEFPSGLVAVVSDSWDVYKATKDLWGRRLKQDVLSREGTVVIRPDSGDPVVVVPRLLGILGKEYGTTTNDKGYKVLPPQVRLIQGDGINRDSLKDILAAITGAGYSVDNVAFGCGAGLLQDCDRDTSQYAFKCSSAVVRGERRDVFKRPATMSSKNSKKGRLKLLCSPDFSVATGGSGFMTVNQGFEYDECKDLLETVFKNGEVLKESTLDEIRARAAL